MIRCNENYLKLRSSYLFSDIAKRVDAFQQDKGLPRGGLTILTLETLGVKI